MNRPLFFLCISTGALLAGLAAGVSAEPTSKIPLIGRWDLAVADGRGTYPSWLEVRLSGSHTLVGSYVGHFGSARPVSEVRWENGHFGFEVPVQWEAGSEHIRLEGDLANDRLTGTLKDSEGKSTTWTGVRAPALHRSGEPRWGQPIEVFNGKSLDGWMARNPAGRNGWVVEQGVLKDKQPGNDLVTNQKFTDFKVHLDFRYPQGSNSGVYLRGRYEAQIEDDYGQEPESHLIGGIYGFLTPRINAAKKAGEWQTYDATLIGRRLTLALNGEVVIDRQEIPGITGGALDSNEAEPGPLMLQGDHGQVEFRKVVVTPAL
jgi:hypothetical protein